jgi:uncharacterized NAD(P)/FAD-binding protein YdhS
VLAAAHLLKHPSTLRVDLFEPGENPAAGIAYATENPVHLLNVAAKGMSAFADQPDHFVEWVKGIPKWMPDGGWTPRSFVPRRLYRDYLASLAEPYISSGRLQLHRKQVVDLVERPDGVELVASDGSRCRADGAVLATGNESPAGKPAPWRRDYWSSPSGFDIPTDASVVVIGTGLSMVDSVMSLLEKGHSGPIAAISRRGLVPRPHDHVARRAPLEGSEVPPEASISRLCRWLRERVRQVERDDRGDWRSVVDSLRPYSQEIWRALATVEKRRFLRHARPWWDVHRHRMAPEIHDRIEAAKASGQLALFAARLAAIEENGVGASVRFVPRGTAAERTIEADYVIDCRGHSSDAQSTGNPLLRALFSDGRLRPDPLRLAVDVTGDCATVDAQGKASRRVFAVGPATVGAFWEIVAVPDIRLQVERLAARLVADQVVSTPKRAAPAA